MRVTFIVDWGYKHIYFFEKHLPVFDFSGSIDITNG